MKLKEDQFEFPDQQLHIREDCVCCEEADQIIEMQAVTIARRDAFIAELQEEVAYERSRRLVA